VEGDSGKGLNEKAARKAYSALDRKAQIALRKLVGGGPRAPGTAKHRFGG